MRCNIDKLASRTFFTGLWLMAFCMFMFLIPVEIALGVLAIGAGAVILWGIKKIADRGETCSR